jgi:hypothetical protein
MSYAFEVTTCIASIANIQQDARNGTTHSPHGILFLALQLQKALATGHVRVQITAHSVQELLLVGENRI